MNLVKGLPSIAYAGVCEGCVLGKHARHSFPSEKPSQVSTPLELVHVNLCGPM